MDLLSGMHHVYEYKTKASLTFNGFAVSANRHVSGFQSNVSNFEAMVIAQAASQW